MHPLGPIESWVVLQLGLRHFLKIQPAKTAAAIKNTSDINRSAVALSNLSSVEGTHDFLFENPNLNNHQKPFKKCVSTSINHDFPIIEPSIVNHQYLFSHLFTI